MAVFTDAFETLLQRFAEAPDAGEQLAVLGEIEALRSRFQSMQSLAGIRHTMDTRDAFYEAENAFFDEQGPNYEALNHRFYAALLEARFRPAIEARWGAHLFQLAAMRLRTFSPEILEDLQEENRLSSAYTRLKAGAVIHFRGEEYNLSSIRKWEEHPDRATRRAAAEAKWSFFEEHAERFDELFDQLVAVRHRIARKLGFPHFIPLAYQRLGRSDYDARQVATFRQAMVDQVVPLASMLYRQQAERLGLESLKYYDEPYRFASGNPEPQGEPAWIIEQAGHLYRALSPETGAFFDLLERRGLMDLQTRPGKATGGYCTFLPDQQVPFIFSNFNGTSGDVDVLTHEAGHAFQVFSSRKQGLQEYYWPTLEACEIHSMSMEFFTWPWMDLFFGQEADKYRFAHLAGAIKFMPYGAAVDAFQHFVYENPDCGPAGRHRAWAEIERTFLPQRDYDGHGFLEEGRFWIRQNHIFTVPFYYIDYVLAQVCALQFWQRDRASHKEAWADYLALCRAGGSRPFLELVRLAGLDSPFGKGVLEPLMAQAKAYLESRAAEVV